MTMVWLLLVSFAGHMTMTQMPDMATCRAILAQAIDANTTVSLSDQHAVRPWNIQRAQCLSGDER